MEKNNSRPRTKTPIPSIDELLMMETNPLPPSYEPPSDTRPEETAQAGEQGDDVPAAGKGKQDKKQKGVLDDSKERRAIIQSSSFLTRLKDYDDKYRSRQLAVDRRTVMVDNVIQDTIQSLDLGMSKQNIINAMLIACIEEHAGELLPFVKRMSLL